MKALQIEMFGSPAEVVKAVDIPHVGAPAAGEVVIAVEASPINQYDLLMIAGGYGYRPRLPAIMGTEGGRSGSGNGGHSGRADGTHFSGLGVLNVSSADDAPLVPDDALIFRDGEACVPIVRKGHINLAKVRLGNDDGREVEIASGLSTGDLIAANVGQGVEEGDPVQAVMLDSAQAH